MSPAGRAEPETNVTASSSRRAPATAQGVMARPSTGATQSSSSEPSSCPAVIAILTLCALLGPTDD